MKSLHIVAFCIVLSAPCFSQQDYKSYLDNRGSIDPVYIDNAIRELYSNKISNSNSNSFSDVKVSSSIYSDNSDKLDDVHMLVLTTTTASVEGGVTWGTHGISSGDKIVGITAKVIYTTNEAITPGYTFSNGYQFDIIQTNDVVEIALHTTNSENILLKPVKIIVFYID